MVGLTLLAEARAAGLTVQAEGDRLVIRGPKDADPIARRLLECKAEVLAELRIEAEIAWRVAAMRPQLPARGAIPFLLARDVMPAPACCLSCGDPLEAGRLCRCGPCARAAELVINAAREEV